MGIPVSDKFELLNFREESVPKDGTGSVRLDLYVHLPRNKRYVLFLLEGNPFGKRHMQMLNRHKTPEVFCKFTDFEIKCPGEPIPDTPHNRLAQEFQEDKDAFRAKYPSEFSQEALDGSITELAEEEKNSSFTLSNKESNARSSETVLATTQTESSNGNIKSTHASEEISSSSQQTIEGNKEEHTGGRQTMPGDKEDYSGTKQSIASAKENFSGTKQSLHEKETFSGTKQSIASNKEEFSGSRQTINKSVAANPMEALLNSDKNTTAEELNKSISGGLTEIFKEFLGVPPTRMSLKETPITELTQELMSLIAPEVEGLRNHLRKIPEYEYIMKSSEAITAIAVLFCLAKGQSSRSIFREVSYACLLMDMGMGSFTEDDFAFYYQDRSLLDKKKTELLLKHPKRSYDVVQARFKNLPDMVGKIILGHHELYNGEGYPREVRSDLLPPIVRIVAYAVDVYESMKKASLNEGDLLLGDAVKNLQGNDLPPHMRRHSPLLMREVAMYLAE